MESLGNRADKKEESISDLEDRNLEMIQSVEERKLRFLKSEEPPWVLSDSIRNENRIISVPEKQREQGADS